MPPAPRMPQASMPPPSGEAMPLPPPLLNSGNIDPAAAGEVPITGPEQDTLDLLTGQKNGDFLVERGDPGSGRVENGWDLVHEIGDYKPPEGSVLIVKPVFDEAGNHAVDETGNPDYEAKVVSTGKLLAWQDLELSSTGELAEADVALQDVGSAPVAGEVSVEYVDPTIPEEGLIDESNEAETVDAESEELNGVEADELGNEELAEKLDDLRSTFEQLPQIFEGVSSTINRIPGVVSEGIEEIKINSARSMEQISYEVNGIKSILREVNTSFIYRLNDQPQLQVEHRDRQSVEDIRDMVRAVVGRLDTLIESTGAAKRAGETVQDEAGNSISLTLRKALSGLDEFRTIGALKAMNEAEGVASELASDALEKKENTDDTESKKEVQEAEEFTGRLVFAGGQVLRGTEMTMAAVEDAKALSRRVSGSEAVGAVEELLQLARLRPQDLDNLRSEFSRISGRLEYEVNDRSTNGALFESMVGIGRTLNDLVEQVERLRTPELSESEQYNSLNKLIRAADDVRGQSRNLSGTVQQVASEAQG